MAANVGLITNFLKCRLIPYLWQKLNQKMKKILLFVAVCFTINAAFSQDSLNMLKLGHLNYNVQLSNLWGYADEGHEYAIVGTVNGTSIVDVTDPSNPVEVYFKPGANSTWREVKVWNHHAYVTTEGGGGMHIIDMTPLPQNTNLSSVSFTGTVHQFATAHTLYIDENGILYVFGSDYGEGGALIYDLNQDPSSPVELGVFDDYYIHDGFVRGDTLWASCIYDGFLSVIDVSNKANPTEVVTFNTPSNFTHNSWPTADNHFLFTTDEVSNAYVTSYNVSNFENIIELDRFRHFPGSGSIPHNAHLLGNFLYVSYYKDGVVIIDVRNPANLVETGYYDTAPTMEGDGFNGCWGVYPYLPSGNILASDMSSGLWILGFNGTQACLLEGIVTDISNGNTLTGVTVEILATDISTASNTTGEYATGTAVANTYSVRFSKGGYITETVDNVTLANGTTTTLDVALTPDIPFAFTGQVVEEETGNGIENAQVKIHNNQFDLNVTADANGFFNLPQFFAGNYEVVAGKWGYVTRCDDEFITSSTGNLVVELAKGYYDDFSFHFGWTNSGSSPTGRWERGVPAGTTFNGNQVNPAADVDDDCLNMAYITGNDGGSAGDDDVDDGNVILTSPVFDLSGYIEPYIHYSRWFYNGGGNGSTPDDTLKIEITNGQTTVPLERATFATPGMSNWVQRSLKISDYITPTASMRIIVTANDASPGHLVEAGLDKFYIRENSNISINEKYSSLLKIFPNPAGNFVMLEFLEKINSDLHLQFSDVSGRLLYQKTISEQKTTINISSLERGIYFVKLSDKTRNVLQTGKLVKE